MTVRSPKTEHHPNGAFRVVPIFAALRPYLEEAWDRADQGAQFVISSWRSESKNFRTRMHRIIRRAGLQVWPRVFHNLRASCQTELEDEFPSHVVCSWIGNSERVAREHYLQVTDEHFARAANHTEALQNPVQHAAASARTESQSNSAESDKPPPLQELAPPCDSTRDWQVHPAGLEPTTYGLGNRRSIQLSYGCKVDEPITRQRR